MSIEAGTPERRKALVSMAKLYTQTALRMQGPVTAPVDDGGTSVQQG